MTEHELRADRLIARMTIDEKIAQMHSIWLIISPDGNHRVKTLKGVRQDQSNHDPWFLMRNGIGQISRPLGSAPIDPLVGVRGLNAIQEFLVKSTRLGIPALPHEECLAGLMAQGATMFPSALNMGSLWDEGLVREIAAAIGTEAVSAGARQGLAPVLDVVRDVRWGRTEECFGEDPYLVGSLGTAYVTGLQGSGRRMLATLKHFAGHSFSEGGRNHAPVRIGTRELNDQFLLPFEMAIRHGDAGSVMPAYHELDGEPFHESVFFLSTLLRDRWGFQGLVVADYEGISQLHLDHRTCTSPEDAAAKALIAGVDTDLPGDTSYGSTLKNALDRGLVDGALVDRAVRRILVEKSRLGLFDQPYVQESTVVLGTDEHRSLSRDAAARSMVLLKNNGVLPLGDGIRVALIGPLADDPLAMLNGYSFPVHLIASGTQDCIGNRRTVLKELSDRLGDRLVYQRGCDILVDRPTDAPVFPGEIGQDGSSQKTHISRDISSIPAAAAAARESDVVVVMVGDLSGLFLTGTVGEGSDVSSLRPPGPQEQLVDALLDTGKPVVVVISSGRPYRFERAEREAAAILQIWLPGGEGAAALTDVLFGISDPCGRLPVSVPRSAGMMPFFYNHKMKSAGTPIQPDFGAVYPFGFGMGYSKFLLGDFSIESPTVPIDGEVVVSCSVSNTGEREGDEVVQVYIRDIYASLVRPVKELKAYRRIRLQPGTTRNIVFSIPCDMLSFTGRDGERFLEAGDFKVMVGTSSRDIAYSGVVTVVGEDRKILGEWRMRSRSVIT